MFPKHILRPRVGVRKTYKNPAMKYSALFNIRSCISESEFHHQNVQPATTIFGKECRRQNASGTSRTYNRIILHRSETYLGGGSSYDLGRSIVEMPIIIVVEHAGVEEFLLPNGDQDLLSKAVAERVQESELSSEVCSSIRGLRKFRSQRCFLNSRI